MALGFNGTLSRFGGASATPLPPPRMRPDLANVALVAATGPDAANFRVRGTLLAPALREHGVALDPLPLFDAQGDVLFHSADPRRRARILLAARRAQRARLDAAWPALRTVLLLRQADLVPRSASKRPRPTTEKWSTTSTTRSGTTPAAPAATPSRS